MVRELNQHYDETGRAFHVKRVAGGFQMRTRPQFADWIGRLDHTPPPKRLSNPALDTLTVVAYRQPIIKAEIEAIRGVSCGEMLRQLLESGLVKIAGRSEKLGRPFLYATSKEFLTQFGFNSLNELPRAQQLAGHGLPQWASSDENRDQPEQVVEFPEPPSTPEPHASPQKEEEE
jgi:segregation and condensation protein B